MPAVPESTWLPDELRRALLADVYRFIEETDVEQAAHDQADVSFNNGSSGLALFFANAHFVFPGRGFDRIACRLADHAVTNADLTNPALFTGATGVMWTALEVDRLTGNFENARIARDYDEVLLESLHPAWPGHFDLISGIVGVGVYGLSRLPSPEASEITRRVLDVLEMMATYQEGNTYWATLNHMMPWSPMWNRFHDGVAVDLGAAHGNAGVIAFLAKVIQADVDAPRAQRLIEPAVDWLLGQAFPTPTVSLFPNLKDDSALSSRAAWCYGDFSVANALLLAGKACERPDWVAHARRIFEWCMARPIETMQFDDAWLCHGAAGVAHMFQRASDALDHPGLRAASARLFAEARSIEESARRSNDFDPESRSVIEGPTGFRLSAITACFDCETRWDLPFVLA